MSSSHYILKLQCVDRHGIVAAVATSLKDHDCNIEESAQFHDELSKQFFMRVVFSAEDQDVKQAFCKDFTQIASDFEMDWDVYPLDHPVKALILVSKTDHCLNDLLYRHRTAALNIDIKGVLSNHETNRDLVESRGIDYKYLPVTKEDKQEGAIRDAIDETGAELIILARYMQILSDGFCRDYAGRVINIHHSFLPGFKGAQPYRQAFERGVKIIGATAHFATSDLDEGPIIEQETKRIDHAHTPQKLQKIGRDIESRVLARGIELYTERRIFTHGNRTVIL